MRKSVLLLASMALALVLVSGVAWAVTKDCTPAPDYCIGTADPDTLKGSAERDRIYGLEGGDDLFGNGGDDFVRGEEGDDTLIGGVGVDNLDGQQGRNKIYGGKGGDDLNADWAGPNRILGGEGDDDLYGNGKLDGGPGSDYIEGSHAHGRSERILIGGPGTDRILSNKFADDTIYAEDGERDVISCGGGEDTVYFDKGIDSVNPLNCENRIGK